MRAGAGSKDIGLAAHGKKRIEWAERDMPVLRRMKDGSTVSNSGHFNVDFDLNGLKKISKKKREVREKR